MFKKLLSQPWFFVWVCLGVGVTIAGFFTTESGRHISLSDAERARQAGQFDAAAIYTLCGALREISFSIVFVAVICTLIVCLAISGVSNRTDSSRSG